MTSVMIQGCDKCNCHKSVIIAQSSRAWGALVLNLLPVSASPSHGSLCQSTLHTAPVAGTASPHPGHTHGRSLAWTLEKHSPLRCWRHDSRRHPQIPSCSADKSFNSSTRWTHLAYTHLKRMCNYSVLCPHILMLISHFLLHYSTQECHKNMGRVINAFMVLTYFDLSLAFQDFQDQGQPLSYPSRSVEKNI